MNSERNDMNGWTTTKVFRINGTLVIGRSVEDAIKVYRDFCAPSDVTIESIEMVFGESTKLDKDAIIADQGAKAAEAIALLTEQNEELRKKYADLESRFVELKKDNAMLREGMQIPTSLPVVLGVVSEEYQEPSENPEIDVNQWSRQALEKALERNGGDRKKTAQELGISDRTLYRRLKQYGLDMMLKKIEQKKEDTSEFTPFETELFSMMSDAWQGYLHGEEVNITKIVKEHSSELLERANEQKPYDRSRLIEIPFGSNDSELLEEIITIPEGFYAVIEGDKIILRKGENFADKVEPKFKVVDWLEDYEIRIKADNNDKVYWQLLRKGEPAACNEEEIRMVSQIFSELKEKIDRQYL